MPAYHFIAVNHASQEQKGVIEAESEKQARQLLRDRTLIPISFAPRKEKKKDQENHC